MKIQVIVICAVTPCSVVVGYQHFGRPFCVTLKMETAWFTETMVSYHVATHKTTTSRHYKHILKATTFHNNYKIKKKSRIFTCRGHVT
jgi:hypothetical protein